MATDGGSVRIEREGPLALVVLDRPERHNAFDDALIAELTDAFAALGADPAVRCVVVTGAGRSFSAGADLGWMRRAAGYAFEENLEDARRLHRMLQTLDELGKPTVAMVNGPAIGGGVGLVCACDVAIAADRAFFQLSEVRLGLLPAVISPFVVRAVGERHARRFMLTAERIGAEEARRIGLVHEVVEAAALERRVKELVGEILAGAPGAQAETKSLLRVIRQLEGSLLAEATARAIAERRASEEAKEGISAFFEKRLPAWRGAEGG